MATDKTRALTAPLTSTQTQAFTPPRLNETGRARVRSLALGQRPVIDFYRDRRGRLYAHDGISIRRVQ